MSWRDALRERIEDERAAQEAARKTPPPPTLEDALDVIAALKEWAAGDDESHPLLVRARELLRRAGR